MLEAVGAGGRRRAPKRRSSPTLAEIVDEVEGALGDGPHAYLRANWRFHDRVAQLCPNVPMRSVSDAGGDVLARGLDDFAFDDDEAAIAVHRELVEAMAAGDAARLDRAVVAHMARPPLSPKRG